MVQKMMDSASPAGLLQGPGWQMPAAWAQTHSAARGLAGAARREPWARARAGQRALRPAAKPAAPAVRQRLAQPGAARQA